MLTCISDTFNNIMDVKNYTDILWDFNGTVIDDVDADIKSVNALLERRGLKTLDSHEEYYKVFGFPIIDYYKRLGFDLEKEDYETVIAPEWVNEYKENRKNIKVRDGVVELLEFFKSRRLRQTIISASESSILDRQLRELGIRHYFYKIYGLDNIYAAGKKSLGVLWRNNNPNAKALFLGDTEHDAEVADAIQADCILIEGGHSSAEKLKNSGHTTVKTPIDIVKLLK